MKACVVAAPFCAADCEVQREVCRGVDIKLDDNARLQQGEQLLNPEADAAELSAGDSRPQDVRAGGHLGATHTLSMHIKCRRSL